MNAIARCEWVSPIKTFTSRSGEEVRKVEVKFTFGDTDNYLNEAVIPLYGERADRAARELKAGESYSIAFRLKTFRTAGGAEYNDISLRSIKLGDKEIV